MDLNKDILMRMPNLKVVQLELCLELFLNREVIQHFIRQGCYVVSSGWLRQYKRQIENWGFADSEAARRFFGESMKKILWLETQLPGDLNESISALAEYTGLPYEVLPVGMTHCEQLVDSLVMEWKMDSERESTNMILSRSSIRFANYFMILNQLDKLIQLADEKEIVQVIFDLINVLFAPLNVEYVSFNDGRVIHKYTFKEDIDTLQLHSGQSFDIEVQYKGLLLGIFSIMGLQFPKYLEQYKEMSRVISQIAALSIANAREYKITQEQKEQMEIYARELKEANRSKDKFISVLSHDLKNPFNILVGYSHLLVEGLESNDLLDAKECALVIRQTIDNTLKLLENLLEWTRNESGMIRFNPESIELNELLDQVLALLNQQADVKGISITRSIPSGVQVIADREMLSTILRNLISNALKYTRSGGAINISAECTPEAVVFSVRDNGIGMSSEKLESLFLHDQRESSPGTDQEKGTGLGLILAHDFVKAHGGNIWAESEKDQGSVFYFTIPITG
jgi:signal transduction histidine kinase